MRATAWMTGLCARAAKLPSWDEFVVRAGKPIEVSSEQMAEHRAHWEEMTAGRNRIEVDDVRE